MNTTVYLIRHSIRFNKDYIEQYNSSQNATLKNEKVMLSVEGERRAEILSNEEELRNLDVIYASNCVRTLQTAKYIITFFIMKWCEFEYIEEEDYMKFTFKDKVIFNKRINAPEVFKLEFDENDELIDIQNIEFNDLPYKDGMGKKEKIWKETK